MESDRRAELRDRVHPEPRHPSGLHGRPLHRRPRGDARRHEAARWRPGQDQPAAAGGARHRPLDPGRQLRRRRLLRPERRDRVLAQHRALPLPPLGPEDLRRLPRRAPADGDRAPGQPRVPGARGLRRPEQAPPQGVPRQRGRHGLAHHHGQRPGRAGLGRGRHRGRGSHAGPACDHADSPGHRLRADGAPRRRHHRREDSCVLTCVTQMLRKEGRRRQVRRVLRQGPAVAAARGPGDHRQHGPGVRCHLRHLPHRRGDAPLPAPLPGAPKPLIVQLVERLHQGAGALPHRQYAAGALHGHRLARPGHGRAQHGRPAAPPGPGAPRRRPPIVRGRAGLAPQGQGAGGGLRGRRGDGGGGVDHAPPGGRRSRGRELATHSSRTDRSSSRPSPAAPTPRTPRSSSRRASWRRRRWRAASPPSPG